MSGDEVDVGGDPPCWSHLFGDADAHAATAVVADLGSCCTAGASGAIWSLPHGGDLDANVVRLGPGDSIGDHVNDDVDVLLFVQSGRGELVVDDRHHVLRADIVALVPRGARRAIRATAAGITYLSVHARRSPLAIRSRRTGAVPEEGT